MAADRSCACALWGQEMLLPGGAGHARGKHSKKAGFIAAQPDKAEAERVVVSGILGMGQLAL